MSELRVRLGIEPVVHGAASGGWTTCGIMHSTDPGGFFFMKAVSTDDPVDCMACLVQEARGDVETLAIRGIVKVPPMPIHVIEFVIDTEPKK